MKIPKFWASAEMDARKRSGEVVKIRKWSWSDSGESEAERKAWRAAEAAAARITAGEAFPERATYYADHPLREEIVSEISSPDGESAALVTRNAYGCLVLNTAKIMFVDIDLPADRPKKPAGFLSRLFGGASAEPEMSEEQKALAKVESWITRNSSWSFRAYRTASGLRLMATHETFDPESTQTARVLEDLGCDPLFMRLCRTQKSFRARLTPKPWRIGVENPGFRFPYKATQAVVAANWRTRYEERSLEWATCAFISTIGRESVCEDARAIVAHHDQTTKVNSGQKLA